MRTRAAVVRESPGELEVVDIDLEAPRQNELRIKMVAAGLCHSGDHLPVRQQPSHRARLALRRPRQLPLALDGAPVGQLAGLGTFAERTVVSTLSAVEVEMDLPLDKVVLLGCGVGTGWGSAVYAGDFARFVTNGQGADKAIVAVEVTSGEHVAQGFEAIRKAGTVVVTGIGDMTGEGGIPVNPWMLTMMQKRIQGALFGSNNPMSDIPRQIRMYQAGQLKLDELITRTYTLDEINTGYEDMHAGRNIRGVILFD